MSAAAAGRYSGQTSGGLEETSDFPPVETIWWMNRNVMRMWITLDTGRDGQELSERCTTGFTFFNFRLPFPSRTTAHNNHDECFQ